MIGNAIVREVVGADFFAAVSSANLAVAYVAYGAYGFLVLELKEFGSEHVHGFFAVGVLGALGTRRDDDACWLVGEANGGFYFVYVLPARATTTGKCYFNV